MYDRSLDKSYHAQLKRSLSLNTGKINYLHGIHNRNSMSKTQEIDNFTKRKRKVSKNISEELQTLIHFRCKRGLMEDIPNLSKIIVNHHKN